jgi:hypothetical protein
MGIGVFYSTKPALLGSFIFSRREKDKLFRDSPATYRVLR